MYVEGFGFEMKIMATIMMAAVSFKRNGAHRCVWNQKTLRFDLEARMDRDVLAVVDAPFNPSDLIWSWIWSKLLYWFKKCWNENGGPALMVYITLRAKSPCTHVLQWMLSLPLPLSPAWALPPPSIWTPCSWWRWTASLRSTRRTCSLRLWQHKEVKTLPSLLKDFTPIPRSHRRASRPLPSTPNKTQVRPRLQVRSWTWR